MALLADVEPPQQPAIKLYCHAGAKRANSRLKVFKLVYVNETQSEAVSPLKRIPMCDFVCGAGSGSGLGSSAAGEVCWGLSAAGAVCWGSSAAAAVCLGSSAAGACYHKYSARSDGHRNVQYAW
jgi:hypothetical protein